MAEAGWEISVMQFITLSVNQREAARRAGPSADSYNSFTARTDRFG